MRAVPSSDAVTTRVLSRLNVTSLITPLWPEMTATRLPVSASQISASSVDAVATRRLSGLKADARGSRCLRGQNGELAKVQAPIDQGRFQFGCGLLVGGFQRKQRTGGDIAGIDALVGERGQGAAARLHRLIALRVGVLRRLFGLLGLGPGELGLGELGLRLRDPPLPAGQHDKHQRRRQADSNAPRNPPVCRRQILRVADAPFLLVALAVAPRRVRSRGLA